MRHKRRTRLVAALAVPLLAASACGPPPTVGGDDSPGTATPVYDRFDEMDEDERMAALIAEAEAEGTVVAHLRSDEVGPEIERAFEAKYDIDLVILNPGNTQSVSQQVFEQSRAGRLEADLVEVMNYEVNKIFVTEGVMAPMPRFLGESAQDPSLVHEFGIETHSYAFPVYWNTNEVKGDRVPTSLEDLTDEFWDARLVMMTNNFHWYMTIYQILVEDQGMSVEDFETLMVSIAEKSDKTNSNNPAAQGMASGQYWGTPSGALVSFQRVQGAPFDYQPPIEPVPVVPANVGLLKDAPHPAAAMLFTHWYLTEGLDITVDEHFIGYHDDETDLEGVETRRLNMDELTTERLASWRNVYNDLLMGRTPAVPEYERGN